MPDLSTLQAGFAFPPEAFILDRETVRTYLEAVEDDSPIYAGPDAPVPPLAVLALTLRGLADLIARNPGTVHISQRLMARRAAPVGTPVSAHLRVGGRSERRGFAVLSLEVRVEAAATTLLEGVTVLMVPLAAGGGDDG